MEIKDIDEILWDYNPETTFTTLKILLLGNKYYWTTKAGIKVIIKDMSTSHLQNTINKLKKEKEKTVKTLAYLKVMEKEFNTRKLETNL